MDGLLVIINFKAYSQSSGENAVKLAKLCEEISKKSKVDVAVAVQPADIYRVSKAVRIKVLSQHIDPIDRGPFTGHINVENIKENGAVGTLLNHSEKRISNSLIKQSVGYAKKAGLLTVVCASTPAIAKAAAKTNPDFIAIEPPELIGGKISVSTAKPQIITNTIKVAGNIPVLCGAGIKTTDDVRKAYQLGASGILVASGVVLAQNQKEELENLITKVRV